MNDTVWSSEDVCRGGKMNKSNYQQFKKMFKKGQHIYVGGITWDSFGYINYFDESGFGLTTNKNSKVNHFNWDQFEVICEDMLMIERSTPPKKVQALRIIINRWKDKDGVKYSHPVAPKYTVDGYSESDINKQFKKITDKPDKFLFAGDFIDLAYEILSKKDYNITNKGIIKIQHPTLDIGISAHTDSWGSLLYGCFRDFISDELVLGSYLKTEPYAGDAEYLCIVRPYHHDKYIKTYTDFKKCLDPKNWTYLRGDPFIADAPNVIYNCDSISFISVW